MPRLYVLGLGDPLCRNGFGMLQNFVTDFVLVQTIDELLWNFHNRLRSKLSLSRAISTSKTRAGKHRSGPSHSRVEQFLPENNGTPPQTRRRANNLCMARCEVCENEYDKAFEVIVAGKHHTFDSFECAIHALAPVCPHCHCRIVGHGVEADGQIFCCVHCARTAGKTQLKDRSDPEPALEVNV